jgi:hypothetical protein
MPSLLEDVSMTEELDAALELLLPSLDFAASLLLLTGPIVIDDEEPSLLDWVIVMLLELTLEEYVYSLLELGS